jgi:uncharacterized RDD family membrane protein YckC
MPVATVGVVTAPGGFVPDPTDVMGRRIAAYLIDVVLLLVIMAAIAIPIAVSDAAQLDAPTSGAATDYCDEYNDRPNDGVCLPIDNEMYVFSENDADKAAGIVGGISVGYYVLNWWLLQGLVGGSIGKLIVGLRVVKYDGSRAGLGRVALRTLLLIVDAGFCWIPGLVAAFSTKGHRRIGDLAAKTLVVPKAYMGHQLAVPGLTVPESAAYVGAGWPAPGGGMPPTTPPPGAATGGWTAPSAPEPERSAPSETAQDTPAPEATSATGAAASGDGPHWDEARQAYLQYDHARGAWLQWDDAAKEWKQT